MNKSTKNTQDEKDKWAQAKQFTGLAICAAGVFDSVSTRVGDNPNLGYGLAAIVTVAVIAWVVNK